MKISKIKVCNFRSIKTAEISANDFNVFVGQNNHGKTNFFEAIDWFYGGKGDIDKIRFGRSGTEEVSVEIEFSEIQDGIDKMKNEKNKTAIKNLLGEKTSVRVKRTSLEVKTRKIFDDKTNDWLVKNPTGFDPAFNDFLPKFEYVSTKMDPQSLTKYGKNTPIANMLSGVLATILESGDNTYTKFRDQFDELFSSPDSQVRIKLDELSGKVKVYLEKQFADCNKVSFEVDPPVFEDLLKNFETSIDDGVYTDAEEKGDGMQRALMLAIIQAYADFRKENEETNKFFLFFIDEGELHLHPTAQRKLKNALIELANKGDQVFINTHSSVLVVDENKNQTIFKVEKNNKETAITPICITEKPYIIYELLGGSPSDLLLPKNFLIVEGKSEQEFLTKIISRFYSEKPNIQIIPADGDLDQVNRSFNAIEHIFKPIETSIYNDKVVVAVDKHDASHTTSFKNNHLELFTTERFFEIDTPSIEEYYPTLWKIETSEVKKKDGSKKIELARKVGNEISKDVFEKEMSKIKDALEKCWLSCFK
ncbi:MAG: chromosome segregation protein SMC [Candidatus Taylorbacteria bacterium RIFOXYD2_FULL_36_9]|uniref:Chromosome segregation protein SMC n=1 Tax=Candidatus Taylorbacteria bacterium RIFOXYD2_FULL_36_9 TaxID=1802338 RepID=A0A1G2PIC1_9BACT|nr:MAG: chromosome segregation protein SMC [Candidatus Taylorbacteria bacterium RIFOXYD2_FULL_36_9]